MKVTLITGASKGLGKEFAKIFYSEGSNLLLVGSSLKRLEDAKNEIIDSKRDLIIDLIEADLTKIDECKKVFEYAKEKGYFVNNLVNNAGFGDRCDFKDMDIDKQIDLNNLNINAVLYFTRVFLDDMLKEKEGHIINIASIAGYVPGPYMSTYHASKAYLVNLGFSLQHELKGTGVHIFTLNPGPFESNFTNVAHNEYTFSKIKPMTAERVAKYGYKCAMKGCVNKVVGFKNKLTTFAPRFFSHKFVAAQSAATMKAKEK